LDQKALSYSENNFTSDEPYASDSRLPTRDSDWHSSAITVPFEPLGETTGLAQYPSGSVLTDELNRDLRDKSLLVKHKLDWIEARGAPQGSRLIDR
jgi:hypothetical protein